MSHSGPTGSFGIIIGSFTGNVALPLFFFISGYLFDYYKYKSSSHIFISKRISRLLMPFFITYFFALILSYFANEFGRRALGHIVITENDNIFNSIKIMLYGIGTTNNPGFLDNPLWFLLCLFCGSMILYIYLSQMDDKNEFLGILFCILIAIIGQSISKHIFLPWSFDIALVSLMTMYLGYLAKKHSIFDQVHEKIPISILILMILLFFVSLFVNWPVNINNRVYGNLILFFLTSTIGIILAVMAAMDLQKISMIKEFLCFFGINSIIILAFHQLLLSYILRVILIFRPDYYQLLNNWFITFLMMLIISLITIFIIRKFMFLRSIYYL